MSDTHINRNWLIAGLVILLAIITLIYSVTTLLSRRGDRLRLGHRSPATTLTYCGTDLNQLCIVSFSQQVDGGMQVNFQIPDAFYPDFTLKIVNNGQESTYECKRGKDRFTTVVCTGAPQMPGQILQFKAISNDTNFLLAEGEFAIIGIALFTPEVDSTATVETPTETPTETPIVFDTPIPMQTPSTPSYPNPSYP